MVSTRPAVLRRSAVAAVSAPTRYGYPTCYTPPTAALTACSAVGTTTCCPPADERWFTPIHGDDELDIWLISWVPDQSTELHDHGGSLGALTLLSGALDEFRWDGEGLRHRRLNAGDQAGFPLGWVHDVVWAPESSAAAVPTLSVHAYSPPLTAMSYYQVTDRNTLRRKRTELTHSPEGQ
jgi:hypothetical protein